MASPGRAAPPSIRTKETTRPSVGTSGTAPGAGGRTTALPACRRWPSRRRSCELRRRSRTGQGSPADICLPAWPRRLWVQTRNTRSISRHACRVRSALRRPGPPDRACSAWRGVTGSDAFNALHQAISPLADTGARMLNDWSPRAAVSGALELTVSKLPLVVASGDILSARTAAISNRKEPSGRLRRYSHRQRRTRLMSRISTFCKLTPGA